MRRQKHQHQDQPSEAVETTEPENQGEASSSLVVGIFRPDGTLIESGEVEASKLNSLLKLTRTSKKATGANKLQKLPALTSSHQTQLPTNSNFEAFTQLGPATAIQLSLWGEDQTQLELLMPNGFKLTLIGDEEESSRRLHKYTTTQYGPEGLKVLLLLIDVYLTLTSGGRDQGAVVEVSLKELMKRLGQEKNTGPKKLQELMSHIEFYRKLFVSEPGRGKSEKRVPLLHLDSYEVAPDADGIMRVPTTIRYSLGKSFIEALQAQFFSVPTAQLFAYHAIKQQQELYLSIYLTRQLTISGGVCRLSLPTILIQSSLQTEETIRSGENRTRDALRALYALEQLEKDGIILRSPHQEVDGALIADMHLCGGETEEDLSDSTRRRTTRILTSLSKQTGVATLSSKHFRTIRRIALQGLLEPEEAKTEVLPLSISAGPVVKRQIEQYWKEHQKGRPLLPAPHSKI